MKKLLVSVLLAFTAMGCEYHPRADEITCSSGHGKCFVVHCEADKLFRCKEYFEKLCPNGFSDSIYGLSNPGHERHVVDCK